MQGLQDLQTVSSSIIGSEKFTRKKLAFRDGSGHRRGEDFLWGPIIEMAHGWGKLPEVLEAASEIWRIIRASASLTAESPLLPQKESRLLIGSKGLPQMT